jgi:hypothetical protein
MKSERGTKVRGSWKPGPSAGRSGTAREADININLVQDSYLSGCRSRVNSAIVSGRRLRLTVTDSLGVQLDYFRVADDPESGQTSQIQGRLSVQSLDLM